MKKKRVTQSRSRVTTEVEKLAVMVSEVISKLEVRLDDMEDEQNILKSKLWHLSNRLDYLEDKFYKK